jgi:glycosyltransferase involved in cell wall biosynthesis
MNRLNQEPSVLILMGTFNGERFIREQLDSIAAQTHKNWKLVISDDGSTDQTLEIAKEWASEVGEGRVEFREGPRKGFAQNFLSMACDSNLRADFYAFSDQDDIWCRDRLSAGLSYIGGGYASLLKLSCGRTTYINENSQSVGRSRAFKKPPCFKNALVQCIAGSNTMLFNHAVKKLLEKSRPSLPIVSHDWWLYLLVSGCGGAVSYSDDPKVFYRQHRKNQVGENLGLIANFTRLKRIFTGHFREMVEMNISALEQIEHLLEKKNRETLSSFSVSRRLNMLSRFRALSHVKVHRQTALDNVALFLAVLIKKL